MMQRYKKESPKEEEDKMHSKYTSHEDNVVEQSKSKTWYKFYKTFFFAEEEFLLLS